MIRNVMVGGALMVVALGCGSDDGTASESSAPAAVDEAPESEETPEVDETSAETPSGDLDAWCLGFTSESPPPDIQGPEDFQAYSEAQHARTLLLLEVAPDEIAEANATLAEAEQVLNEYFADYDWDLNSPRLDPELAETPMRVAGIEMEAFASQNC